MDAPAVLAQKAFRWEVDTLMTSFYGIDWNEASGDLEPLVRAMERQQSAYDFVRYWGEKHDLTPVWEW